MARLHEVLEHHYRSFGRGSISPDPVEFPLAYPRPDDCEVVAFLAANFAFGSMPQIMAVIRKLLAVLGSRPASFLKETTPSVIRREFGGIAHRFYSPEDIAGLMMILGEVCRSGGLEPVFTKAFIEKGSMQATVEEAAACLLRVADGLRIPVTRGIRFMFPLPSKGSACKRTNLFLRWVVRDDEIDMGLWKGIPASALIIPVDTHIARIARQLKFTSRKNVSWAMAEEITASLRRFDPTDPVKYDFSLCHLGIRKLQF